MDVNTEWINSNGSTISSSSTWKYITSESFHTSGGRVVQNDHVAAPSRKKAQPTVASHTPRRNTAYDDADAVADNHEDDCVDDVVSSDSSDGEDVASSDESSDDEDEDEGAEADHDFLREYLNASSFTRLDNVTDGRLDDLRRKPLSGRQDFQKNRGNAPSYLSKYKDHSPDRGHLRFI